MTVKDRAWEICKWLDAEIGRRIEADESGVPLEQIEYSGIRDRIIEALRDQIEACTNVARDHREPRLHGSRSGESLRIEEKIRALADSTEEGGQ